MTNLNNKPDNKNWWCFHCKKWIDKHLETTKFPVYANGFKLVDSYRCNYCQQDTGSDQQINICVDCGKITRILGLGMGYDNGKNTFSAEEGRFMFSR